LMFGAACIAVSTPPIFRVSMPKEEENTFHLTA